MGRQRGRVPTPGAWTEALTPRLRFVLGLPSCPGPAEEEQGGKATHGRRPHPAWLLGGSHGPRPSRGWNCLCPAPGLLPPRRLACRAWLQTFNQVNSSLRVCLRSAHPRGSPLWFGQRGFKVLVVLRASYETALMSQIVYKQLEPEAS